MKPAWTSPIATVDVVILRLRDGHLSVLLSPREEAPFKGAWALPGGFVRTNEDASLEDAARRVLADKAGARSPYLEQLQTFGGPERDPRGWALTVAYFALLADDPELDDAGQRASRGRWFTIADGRVETDLPFDHAAILAAAIERVRRKVEYSSVPVHLLPAAFTLSELQEVYETLLGRPLDKSAFRKKIAAMDFLEPIEGEQRRGSNRPAQLFRARNPDGLVLFDRLV
jgi:ADP-ribose pyrophosphatase YjhB (NUDIX family)